MREPLYDAPSSYRPARYVFAAGVLLAVLLLVWAIPSAPRFAAAAPDQQYASFPCVVLQDVFWEPQQPAPKSRPPGKAKSVEKTDSAFSASSSLRPHLRAPLLFRISAPCLRAALPSWRGLVPYRLPPPSFLSA